MNSDKRKNKRIGAVVVTYNRKKMLLEAIHAIAGQTYPVSAIFIVDNASTDGTADFLFQHDLVSEKPNAICNGTAKGVIKKGDVLLPYDFISNKDIITETGQTTITYAKLTENLGGAGGFREGMKLADSRELDFIWVMDDDAEPEKEALSTLMAHADDEGVVALTGSVWSALGNLQEHHRGYIGFKKLFPFFQTPVPKKHYEKEIIDIDMASFVGLLVKNSIVKKIQYPRGDFFIRHDDVEYSIKLKSCGRIILVPKSRIIHKDFSEINPVKRFFLGRSSIRVSEKRIWLTYFDHRNSVYLARKHAKNPFNFYRQLFVMTVRHVLGIMIYDDFKKERITCFFKAVSDGLTADFQNVYPFKLKQKLDLKRTMIQNGRTPSRS